MGQLIYSRKWAGNENSANREVIFWLSKGTVSDFGTLKTQMLLKGLKRKRTEGS